MSTQVQAAPSSPQRNKSAEDLHTRIARMNIKAKGHSTLFLFLEEPGSSVYAQHFGNAMTLVVVVSIIAFCLETENVS
jgi:hypothetical protein